jgi:CopG family nickel-responsive transcriptional regulator
MTIISVSLNEEYTQILDSIQSAYDLKGRSEAIRLSLDAAREELRELDSLEGTVEGVLIIVRGNHADPWIIQIQARYQEYIKTQMHSHLMDHKCLEVMVVSCDGATLREMMTEIRAQGKAEYVKFVRGRIGASSCCRWGSRSNPHGPSRRHPSTASWPCPRTIPSRSKGSRSRTHREGCTSSRPAPLSRLLSWVSRGRSRRIWHL